MASLELIDLSLAFPGGGFGVRDLSLALADGEVVAVVGPSGSGKSTLLRLAAGLESPTAGRVVIGGRDVTAVSPAARDVAMVFQSYALYPHMSVAANLAFPLRMRRVPRRRRERRVAEVAAMLDLTGLLHRRPAALSGGQQQRVAIGRAVIRDPACFLMDEPLSNLDARLRERIRGELAQLLARLATTTLYVTHDQAEAVTLGHRVAVVREGRLQQVGRPAALFTRPANAFVAAFLGSPGMNLVRGEVAATTGGVVLHLAGATLAVAGTAARPRPGAVVVGFRPEAVRPVAPGEGIAATVAAVEPLGHETVVRCTLATPAVVDAERPATTPDPTATVALRLAPGTQTAVGDPLHLGVDPARLHLFDLDGEALT